MGCSVTGCLMMGCLVMGRLVMGRFVWSPKYLYLTQKKGTKAKFWAQIELLALEQGFKTSLEAENNGTLLVWSSFMDVCYQQEVSANSVNQANMGRVLGNKLIF